MLEIEIKRPLIAIILWCSSSTALACVDPALSTPDSQSNCLELAKQGQADAQFQMGKIYDKGLGVPPSPTAAEVWYLKAAESGLAAAQYALAVMYDNTPETTKQAIEPGYNPVVELRSLNGIGASANLGTTFDLCLDIGAGPIKAVKWYRQAAQQGHTEAQFKLGIVYEQGRGVPQDDMLAYMWFDIAVKQGRKASENNKIRVAVRLSPELQQQAQNLAEEWLQENQRARLD